MTLRKIARALRPVFRRGDFSRLSRLVDGTLRLLATPAEKAVIVNASMFISNGRLEPFNLGDDLNYWLIGELSGRRVFCDNDCLNLRRLPVMMCIGSVLNASWMRAEGNIIWGTGARNGHQPMKGKPAKVLAVRGPLTRNFLLASGIDCPATYGDPALLLPLVYRPAAKKTFRLGIIPHMRDMDNPILERLGKEKDVRIINLKHYMDWRTIIDEIVSCSVVASSSLHGLIIADAYGIRSLWVKFGDETFEGTFKYHDYLLSVGRKGDLSPFCMTEGVATSDIVAAAERCSTAHIDLDSLLNAFPLPLKTGLASDC